MKKQIFILVLFVLAVFASVNKSYGQCTDDALHPMAGKLYHYIISTSGGGTVKSYEWIVTTSTDIVKTGTFATTITPGTATYTIANGDKADASITWSPTLIAAALSGTKYYVAVKVVSTNSEGCDVNNVKAYQIDPVNKFQIDIENVQANGSQLTSGNVCTSNVVDATITPGTPGTIAYNYGKTSMYVKVTARNFTGSWNMDVASTLVDNLNADEDAKLYWSPTIGGTETEVTPGTPINIKETSSDATNDEIIYLRLEVNHSTYDGTTAEGFTFTVNGVDEGGNPDVSSSCTAEVDAVTQTILARPAISNGTTGSGSNTTFLLP